MEQITFNAMGCQMLAAVDGDLPQSRTWLAEVPVWFESWEQHLSRFRPDSELSLVNSRSGSQVISSLLAEVLKEALEAQQVSSGLVNPLLLNALEAAGYDRNFADLPEEITTLNDSTPGAGNHILELDFDRRVLTLPPGGRLDVGGIAKGWAADRAALLLGEHAPTLVDAGGDVAVSGPQGDGSPWPIAVANPLDPKDQLDLVLLSYGGVATSGRDYRRWKKDGRWQHHIIDPRTAQPAVTDVISVTAVAPSARLAETAAKSVLIQGSLDGLRWLDERPELSGLIVLDDGSTIPSRAWLDQIWS